jgi:Na+/melibiose symporter-like transporter
MTAQEAKEPPRDENKQWAKRMLLGPLDLFPLSRMAFLRQALMVFFIRQPIASIIAYFFIYFVEVHELPELMEWILMLAALTAALCFLIPYYRLVYWRLLGSIFPFPRLVLVVLFFILFLFGISSQDELTWTRIILECALYAGGYLILFLLPDRSHRSELNISNSDNHNA